MNRWIRTATLACAMLVACGGADEASKRNAEETRAIMGEIIVAIRAALLASVDEERFRSAESREEISAALGALSTHATLLAEHAGQKDAQMGFLARSVERDAREVHREFEAQRFDRAAFLLRQITEDCVVCHTRLTSPKDTDLPAKIVDGEMITGRTLQERAALQLATRRFDDALTTLEALLASPDVHPAVLLGPLTDYLVVSIRVKDDYDRPIPVLRRFAKRPRLWTRLRMDIERWIEALPELRDRARAKPDLETARALLEDGQRLIVFPEDRAPLVQFITASAILEQIIDTRAELSGEIAEAYYLQGIIEARIGRNYWVTPAPFLLETAIRLAPKADFATEAYAVLERELLMSYEGSDWEEIPPEDRERLDELRALIGDD